MAQNGAVYHDFRGQYISTEADLTLFQRLPVTIKDGFPGQVDGLYRAGYLVPLADL
jgi:hypothetical protein